MIISIFFMLASLCLIIFLPIYLKKKNKLYTLRPQDIKDKSLKKQKKNIKNIWGIDKIQDGIMTIKGRHSIVVELGSIEYRLLNNEEQDAIDSILIGITKTFKNQTQFFSTIEKIDTRDKIETIRENINKQKNQAIKEYGESVIKYLKELMHEENLYVRKNYIIITSNEQFERAKMDLEDFYIGFRESLARIKIKSKKLSDIEIIELINREFNKNPNEKIGSIIMEGGLDFYVKPKNKEKRQKDISC